MRWPRRQQGRPGPPGPVTLAAVGVAVFASAFGVARAAGTDEASPAAAPQTQSAALRNATALPSLASAPGPTPAEIEARRERARERARKRKLEKRREEKAAEQKEAREER